jgi:hypothetical protein
MLSSKNGHAVNSSGSPVLVFKTSYAGPDISSWLAGINVKCEAFDLNAVNVALSDGTNKCVIFWNDPVERVAAALEAGEDAEQVYQSWLADTNSVLGLVRKNRRRTSLIDARIVRPTVSAHNLNAMRDLLCSQELQAPKQGVIAKQTLAQILAGLIVAGRSSAQKILNEIEASGLSAEHSDMMKSDLPTISRLFAHTKLAETERGLLRTQITLQQQEAERTNLELQSLKRQHHKALSDAEAAHKEAITVLEDKLLGQQDAERQSAKAVKEELGLLRTQIMLQQQEAERNQSALGAAEERYQRATLEADRALSRALSDLRAEAKARQAVERQNDRLMRRVGDLSSKLDKVLASSSWRITRPIRTVKNLILGGGKPVDVLIAEQQKQKKNQ